MSKLVRIGTSAFDLDRIAAVDGDRVVFHDGKEIRVSRKAADALVAALPEWRVKAADGTPALPVEGKR